MKSPKRAGKWDSVTSPKHARHAKLNRKKERSARGRRWLFLGIVVAAAWYGWSRLAPWIEEQRLIHLAARRGHFVFGPHGDGEDFANLEPHLQGIFDKARMEHRRIIFIKEHTLSIPFDNRTGKIPPSSQWLDQIALEPVRSRAWYEKASWKWMKEGDHIMEGQFAHPAYYSDEMFGRFERAEDAFLIEHRDLLLEVRFEVPSWEDHIQTERASAAIEEALNLFKAGRPMDCVQTMSRAREARRASSASRDRSLLLRIGRLLDKRSENVAVLTVRGTAHWDMVRRYGLAGYMTPHESTELAVGENYGLPKLDLAEVFGVPLSPLEEKRSMLAHFAGRSFESRLVRNGVPERVARQRAAQAMNLPALTYEKLGDLSVALGRALAERPGQVEMEKFATDWLISHGFAEPIRIQH